MKKAITKKILLFITGFIPLFCAAQTYGEVTFGYDANGNRVSRSVQIIENNRGGQETGTRYLSEVSETFGQMQVKTSPTPKTTPCGIPLGKTPSARLFAIGRETLPPTPWLIMTKRICSITSLPQTARQLFRIFPMITMIFVI